MALQACFVIMIGRGSIQGGTAVTLQIFILGALSEEDHHPYDIKKIMVQAMDSTSVSDGALYYNFEVLWKKGWIQKVKMEQKENRPEKTTYGITEKGQEALKDEIYEVFRSFTNVTSLYSSLLFLDKVDRVKLGYLIEEGIKKRERSRETLHHVDYESVKIPSRNKKAAELIGAHARDMIEGDIRWLNKLLDYVRSLG